jgi:hypothetical protein
MQRHKVNYMQNACLQMLSSHAVIHLAAVLLHAVLHLQHHSACSLRRPCTHNTHTTGP